MQKSRIHLAVGGIQRDGEYRRYRQEQSRIHVLNILPNQRGGGALSVLKVAGVGADSGFGFSTVTVIASVLPIASRLPSTASSVPLAISAGLMGFESFRNFVLCET